MKIFAKVEADKLGRAAQNQRRGSNLKLEA